ncbi:MAG: hypothetical protein LBU91_00430 [Bacteroidales bacterium]|jgi:hypothetical protein|nr:hypothetical protein [Bacteroidales bacterium]
MKKTSVLLFLIFGLMSCTQTKYFVKSEQDLSQLDLEQMDLNFIPLLDESLENSIILTTTYELITSKKYSKLKKYLSSIQSQTSDFYLAKTLYYISKNEYQEAAITLKQIDENAYTFVEDLLFVDLSYELAKRNNVKDFKKFLQDYQAVLDKYPNDKVKKKIIALRIRYVRYHY